MVREMVREAAIAIPPGCCPASLGRKVAGRE